MNGNLDQLRRSPADFILFALMFLGFVLGAAGVVTSSIPAAVTGLVLVGLGVLAFMVKQ